MRQRSDRAIRCTDRSNSTSVQKNAHGPYRVVADPPFCVLYISILVTSWMNHESVALLSEPKCNKLKFFPATAIMVASMTGVGVLAFPNTFVNAGGCLQGIFFQLPFLLMAWITVIAIGMVVKRHNVDEYEEMIISEYSFG